MADGLQLTDEFESNLGAQVVEEFKFPHRGVTDQGPMLRLKLPAGGSVEDAVRKLSQDDRVEFAEPNYVYELQQAANPPNDLDTRLWGLQNKAQRGGRIGADVHATDAWKVSTGSKKPLISVIDTGIDYNHPDLKENIWTNPGEIPGDGIDNDGNGVIDDVHGYNAYADNGDPMDGNSHGTHCAGTIGAVGNNGLGITGVMQEASIMPVKIFSDGGSTSTDAIVRGILYSAKMGARITSNSWGGSARSEAIYQAFQSHPGLHVVAAGNSNFDNDRRDNFPSNYDLENIVAVAATDHNDHKAGFSQWGQKSVDVAAPGRDILSTIPGGKYEFYDGTSMATPHVTGGAGLILSAYPEATNAEVKARLIYGSDRKDALKGISVSNGRVNFGRSLEDDSVAPGAPNDFGAGEIGIRGGSVTWTSVGDDKWEGGAAPTVELWQSSEPLTSENLDKAPRVTLDGAAEVGDLASFGFTTIPAEEPRQFHFAMRSVDNVGNASQLRFATVEVPAAEAAVKDDFEGETVDFEPTGDFHLAEERGRGKVFSSRPSKEGAADVSELISRPIDLSDKKDAFLKFDARTDLGWRETAGVQVSKDGETWESVHDIRRYTEWGEQKVDLAAYAGEKIRFKFVYDALEGKRFGGFKVDNVRLLVG